MKTGPKTGQSEPGAEPKTVKRLSVRICSIPFLTGISSFSSRFSSIRDKPSYELGLLAGGPVCSISLVAGLLGPVRWLVVLACWLYCMSQYVTVATCCLAHAAVWAWLYGQQPCCLPQHEGNTQEARLACSAGGGRG